jgi:hypothetical protein
MNDRTKLHDGHVSFHLDRATLAAVEEAAARDERTKSDWLRVLIRRELRRQGLMDAKKTERAKA